MFQWALLISAMAFAGNTQERTILQFGSSQCLACKQLQPAVDQLVGEGWVVRYVDTDRDRAMADRWKVRQIPTLIVLEKGKEVDRIVGASSFADLKGRLLGRAQIRTPSPASSQSIASSQSLASSQPSASMEGLRSPSEPSRSSMTPVGNAARSASSDVVFASATVPIQPNGLGTAMHAGPERSPAANVMVDPMAATVRIRVDDQRAESVGTGTIIDTHGQEALVLTCGHLFRDSRGQAPVTVEVFQNGQSISLPARVIDFRADEVDMGLVSFHAPFPVPVAKLRPKQLPFQENDPVFSMGCDRGADPSRRDTRITKLNRYLGPANIEIAGAPVQGRSGGGLFDAQGRLIGVCYAADGELNEGLYSGPEVVFSQLDRLGLRRLYDGTESSGASEVGLAGSIPTIPQNQRPVHLAQAAAPPRSAGQREIIAIVREPGKKETVLTIPDAPTPLVEMIQHHGIPQNPIVR